MKKPFYNLLRCLCVLLFLSATVVYAQQAPSPDDSFHKLLAFPSEKEGFKPEPVPKAPRLAPRKKKQDFEDPVVARGYVALRAGDQENALKYFQEACEKKPHSKHGRFGLSTIYIKRKQYRKALAILEPMVKEYPKDYFIKNNLAWLYATADDLSVRNGRRAVELAQEALLEQPNDYHVWSTLAEGYYISGDYQKALRAAQEAFQMGRLLKTDRKSLQVYLDQVRKCARAVEAMTLVE